MEHRERREDPPETDLEYYARPENYRGSNLETFTRFLAAKNKEETKEKTVHKKMKTNSAQRSLFRRYRHILPPEFCDVSPSCSSDDDQEETPSISKVDVSRKLATTTERPRNTNYFEDDNMIQYEQAQMQHNIQKQFCARDDIHRQDSSSMESCISEKTQDETRSESGYGSRLHSDFESFVELQQKQKSTLSNDDEIIDCHSGFHMDTKGTAGGPDSDLNLGQTDETIFAYFQETSPDVVSRSSMISLTRSSTSSRRRSLGTASFSSTKHKQNHLTKEVRRAMFLHRLRRVAATVVNVLKLAKAMIKRTDSPSALLKTFTALSREPEPENEDHSENMKNYGLHFDPSYYRANKEISISTEVKSILRLPPSHRSPEQIQTAMFGLQSLPSFAEYPLHMQEKLTKVAWYEIVTPMRTIIRQGHFAENFYFILSGQAVVTIHKPGEVTPQTAAIMRKGTSFGELALLHHSRRTATVTSHDTVQLLSVGRDDFFDIFMSGHTKDEIPEHIQFISQLEFMKDWPLERLLERPDQCLLHFFKLQDMQEKMDALAETAQRGMVIEDLGELVYLGTKISRQSAGTYEDINDRISSHLKRNMVIVKDSKLSEWFYVVKSGSCQVLKQLKGVSGNLGMARSKSVTAEGRLNRHFSGTWISESKLATVKVLRKRMLSKAFRDVQNTTSEQEPGIRSRNLHDHKQTGLKPSQNHSQGEHKQQTQQPQHPVFVQIELLKPKDVFGLDQVNFNSNLDSNPPSVSLVSLGAECIMLSKAFFMKHTNDHNKQRFSEIIQPYPDEETLQDSLQTKVNWELYKRSLIVKSMAHKHSGLNRPQLTTNLL